VFKRKNVLLRNTHPEKRKMATMVKTEKEERGARQAVPQQNKEKIVKVLVPNEKGKVGWERRAAKLKKTKKQPVRGKQDDRKL